MQINWPDSITEKTFLQDYWQQKPLFIPQAFTDFVSPIDENELAGLACDPDASSRFMQHVQGNEWRMCMGPLEENFFDDISGNKWSLLVSDVEKLLPDFRDYLQPFRFIPDWRIDDLMISYAPPGGSVGAHVDQYDVFLLQAAGVREWQIETTPRQGKQRSVSHEISLLGDFSADQTMQLSAGDMLYLPPHFAHHGIAKADPCMTWSVGFRAPSADEMLPIIMNYILEDLATDDRFSDARRSPSDNPGLITTEDQQQLRQILRRAVEHDDTRLDHWIGRYLTEPKHNNDDLEILTMDWPRLSKMIGSEHRLICNAEKYFAYSETADGAVLYADGDSHPCSLSFAQHLCGQRWVSNKFISPIDQAAATSLFNTSALLLDADATH